MAHGTRRRLDRNCISGKVRFRDHRDAVNALHQIANARSVARDLQLTSNRRECRTYRCTACKGWHLTSRPMSVPAA